MMSEQEKFVKLEEQVKLLEQKLLLLTGKVDIKPIKTGWWYRLCSKFDRAVTTFMNKVPTFIIVGVCILMILLSSFQEITQNGLQSYIKMILVLSVVMLLRKLSCIFYFIQDLIMTWMPMYGVATFAASGVQGVAIYFFAIQFDQISDNDVWMIILVSSIMFLLVHDPVLRTIKRYMQGNHPKWIFYKANFGFTFCFLWAFIIALIVQWLDIAPSLPEVHDHDGNIITIEQSRKDFKLIVQFCGFGMAGIWSIPSRLISQYYVDKEYNEQLNKMSI